MCVSVGADAGVRLRVSGVSVCKLHARLCKLNKELEFLPSWRPDQRRTEGEKRKNERLKLSTKFTCQFLYASTLFLVLHHRLGLGMEMGMRM